MSSIIQNMRQTTGLAYRWPDDNIGLRSIGPRSTTRRSASELMCGMIPISHIENKLVAQMRMAPSKKNSEFSSKRGFGRSSSREAIPFWFAISSPLTGLILGFLGAWLVMWLTS
jgi:hypothetical protein